MKRKRKIESISDDSYYSDVEGSDDSTDEGSLSSFQFQHMST